MKQLVLGFGNEWEAANVVPLRPETQEHLVTLMALMAQAILAVACTSEQHGGQSDDAEAIGQQDQPTTSESEGRGLHAPILGEAGPQ